MEVRDGLLGRWFWRALGASAAVVGVESARGLAVVCMHAASLTRGGYRRSAHRVSNRRAPAPPDLWRVPEQWWSSSPHVVARRLGLQLDLDLRDNLQRALFSTGTYEPSLVRFLGRELRRGDVFADVGAHIGLHALTAARRLRRLGGGRVLAFEPAADSAVKLREAARRAGLHVTVVDLALGDAPGTIDLLGDAEYDVADAGVRSQFGTGPRVATVPVTTFDEWAGETGLDRLDVVKIDVEGAEACVLRGMRDSLSRLRPRAVVVEVRAGILRRAGLVEEDLRDLLRGCRYESTGLRLHRNEVFRPC